MNDNVDIQFKDKYVSAKAMLMYYRNHNEPAFT